MIQAGQNGENGHVEDQEYAEKEAAWVEPIQEQLIPVMEEI